MQSSEKWYEYYMAINKNHLIIVNQEHYYNFQ